MTKNVIIIVLVLACLGLMGSFYQQYQNLQKATKKVESYRNDAEEAERRAIQLAAEAVRCKQVSELNQKKATDAENKLKECRER